jgi:hypothetical protein
MGSASGQGREDFVATVQKVKSFLQRQPYRGIFLVLPGEGEAWLRVASFEPSGNDHVLVAPLPPLRDDGLDWADYFRRCMLRDTEPGQHALIAPPYFVDPYPQNRDLWEALADIIDHHLRWTKARRTWMRAVVPAVGTVQAASDTVGGQ